MGSHSTGLEIALILLIASPIFLIQSYASAENDSIDYPIIIDIAIDEGITITELTTFTISLENEDRPNSVTWELREAEESRTFVNVSDGLEFHDTTDARKLWTFDISLDPESSNDCSCVLVISALENGNDPVEKSQSVFISESELQLPPTLFVPSMYEDNWASSIQSLTGVSNTINGELPEISYYIRESAEVKCNNDDTPTQELSTHYYPEILWSENEFVISLDVTEFGDMWHDVLLISRDLLTALTSTYCVSIRVDNTPPAVVIQGPQEVTEGISGALFDGSDTNDEFWGRGGIVYVWSVSEIIGSYRNNIQILSGVNERIIALDANSSGSYEISLTAIDQAGNSATERMVFIVNNLAPVVRLYIDDAPCFDGDKITVPKDSSFVIDASESSDTDNDIDGLRYIWRVNNVPVYEGSGREMSWPDDVGGEFLLTLEVIDDDSQSSMMSVIIIDDEEGFSLPNQYIILILSATFLVYAIRQRMSQKDSESDIPKWV